MPNNFLDRALDIFDVLEVPVFEVPSVIGAPDSCTERIELPCSRMFKAMSRFSSGISILQPNIMKLRPDLYLRLMNRSIKVTLADVGVYIF